MIRWCFKRNLELRFLWPQNFCGLFAGSICESVMGLLSIALLTTYPFYRLIVRPIAAVIETAWYPLFRPKATDDMITRSEIKVEFNSEASHEEV